MSIRPSKRAFTLIEMLIVITLIATALVSLMMPLSKAIRTERFERSVDQLITKLALAQELMLDFRTDVQLTLTQTDHTLECHIETDQKLPEHLEKAFGRYSTLKGIDQIAFNHESYPQIELQYDHTLGSTPEGELGVYSDNLSQTIVLKGYPTKICRGEYVEKSCEAAYPEEIVSLN